MRKVNIFAFADEAGERIDAQIVAMQRNGLQGLEIRNVDGENVSKISLEKAREVRAKLDDAGLITWSIGSPIGKIDIETGDFAAHMDTLRHTLEVANILGAKNLRMFSFFIPKGKNPEDYKDEVFERLAKMVAAAEGSGVALCHENEKGIYGDMAVRCLEILKAFPQIKGVFDPANFIQCGQDTLEGWKMLKDYIHYMHIKDAMADGSVVPSGHGAGNVKAIAADFIAAGGRDFTIEPHLKTFKGLSDLERAGEASKVGHKFIYDSADAAFDAACSAFKTIVEEV